jgi:hypothetical protein
MILMISQPISKSQLQVGDIMLNEADHVAFFLGWTDGSQTHFYAAQVGIEHEYGLHSHFVLTSFL